MADKEIGRVAFPRTTLFSTTMLYSPVSEYAWRIQGYESTNSKDTKKEQMRNRLARWAVREKAREAHGPK